MDKLRYGFIGAGTINKVHAERLAARDDVVLAAVADVAEAAGDAFAERFSVPGCYTDAKAMLAAEGLDAVVVGVPNAYHAPSALLALEAGCHVLIEKPPAMNAAQAKAVAELAESKGLRVQYGLNMRFHGESDAARSYLDAGRLGEVYHASVMMWRRRGIPGMGGWFTTKSVSGGGALIDVGVHILDLTHYLMGQPRPVAASALTHARFGNHPETYNYLSMWAGPPKPDGTFDVDDLACALIRFDNGASLVVQVSWAANTSDGSNIRIMGDRGGVEIDPGSSVRILSEDNGHIADITPQYKKPDSYAAQHAHFIECIRDPAKKNRTCGRQGLVLQHMLDAIYRSAAEGHEVAIDVDA